MSKAQIYSHVYLQGNRLVLDAQALGWATLLIAAASSATSCGGTIATNDPPNATGGAPLIGPGVCAVYPSGGASTLGAGVCAAYASGGASSESTVVADSGFVAGVCPVFIDASGGATSANGSGDASTGGYPYQGGGIC